MHKCKCITSINQCLIHRYLDRTSHLNTFIQLRCVGFLLVSFIDVRHLASWDFSFYKESIYIYICNTNLFELQEASRKPCVSVNDVYMWSGPWLTKFTNRMIFIHPHLHAWCSLNFLLCVWLREKASISQDRTLTSLIVCHNWSY